MTMTAETTKTVQVNRVHIKATPQAIWGAITPATSRVQWHSFTHHWALAS